MEVNPNSDSNNSSVAPNALGNVQRPGEYLRKIRINQQRELEDVAKELNIPVKTLNALEKDDYKSLPEATFIKGYYRTYAKYLGVDASSLIQRFDEIYANDTGMVATHALKDSPIKIMGKLPGSKRDRNRKWLKRGLIALVVVLILGALVAMIQNWSESSSNNAEVADTSSDVEILNLDAGAAMSGDQLKLDFSRPTSVHIVDAGGNVLATGRQASTIELSGEAPFQIRLDDATAVSLSLNNESIALSPYTVSGKADFRLSR